MKRLSPLVFGVALLMAGVLFFVDQRLYQDAHPPSCDCWNADGYVFNPPGVYGNRSYDLDGSRHTAGQPAVYVRTIWLFGNSGTEDPFVDDQHTMASQLQSRIKYWRVINHSAGGQKISGELAWLHNTPVQSGDIVVFIDGSMDRLAQTPLPHYQALVAAARDYAHHKGATFYHFVQPYIDPIWCCKQMGTPYLNIPSQDFVDSSHMNAQGDTLEANVIYQWLAVF